MQHLSGNAELRNMAGMSSALECVVESMFQCCMIRVIFSCSTVVDCVQNVMAHAQKPDFVFRRNGRVHLNRRGRQFSRLMATEVCASAVVMLDTPCCEVVWRVLATHSICRFPLHFPSCASPCAITFQLDSTAHVLWLLSRNILGTLLDYECLVSYHVFYTMFLIIITMYYVLLLLLLLFHRFIFTSLWC